MKNHVLLIFMLLVILLAVYVAGSLAWDYEKLSTIIATIIAALGIFGVWYELRKDATTKEAEFLMNFNFAFITTDKFVAIEHMLEDTYKNGATLVLPEEKRQDLIDYLVYLESLAPLVLNKMVRLSVIDDLFGYRYFIAVNNETVQNEELCTDENAPFYRGCYRLYPIWKEYRTKKHLPIPLKETGLDETEQYKAFKNREAEKHASAFRL